MQARAQGTASGGSPDADSTALFAAEIEAMVLRPRSPVAETATPSRSDTCPTLTRPLQDEESMPTLTDEIKTFIVKGLACYDSPSQVAEAVKATFGVEVSRQQVYVYDPRCSPPPAQRWRDLHAATRQALLREEAEIGIAHRGVRLRMLERIAQRWEKHSVDTALKCLQMAAKECGTTYGKSRHRAGTDAMPEPIMPDPATPEPETPEPAMSEPATPAAATPQPAIPAPPAPEPTPQPAVAAPQLEAPRPAAATPAAPQPTQPQRPMNVGAPLLSPPRLATPQPAMPQPAMPQPAMPAPAAPPLAVLAQPPLPEASPPGRPLTRWERHLAYVRDRHARDREIAARARAEGAFPHLPSSS
jgi:hypothetical protein